MRKLETMEANLTRVQDLTGEIRRQLGPLGRQAEAARRAAVIQADARDARLRLLADDLVQLTAVLEQEVADETALIERRTAVEDALADVRQRLTDVDRRAAEAAPELSRAQERFVRLQSLRDRLESTGSVAAERVRLLSQDEEHETTSGRDPEELRAQAAQAREAETALLAEVARTTEDLAVAVAAREEAEGVVCRGAGSPVAARPRRRRPSRGPRPARRPGRRPAQPDRGGGGRDRPPPGDRRGRAHARRRGRAGVLPPRGRSRRRGGGRGGPRRRLRDRGRPARRGRGGGRAPRDAGARRRARPVVRDGPARSPRDEPAPQGRRRHAARRGRRRPRHRRHRRRPAPRLRWPRGRRRGRPRLGLGGAGRPLRRARRARHRVAARGRRRPRIPPRRRHGLPERPHLVARARPVGGLGP